MFRKPPKRFAGKIAAKRHSLRLVKLDMPHYLPKRRHPVPSRWTGRLLGHFLLRLS